MKVQFIVLAIILATLAFAQDCNVQNSKKLDCGYLGVTESECYANGCCWQPSGSFFDQILNYFYQFKNIVFGQTGAENGDNVPWCFYEADVCNKFNLSSDEVGFTQDWYDNMYDKFMDNINVVDNGAVCAAPDTNTPGGSYYFHWMRDAALTMRTFMELNDFKYSDIRYNMEKYISWVSHVQHEYDPNGNSVLVEPKFVIPTRQPYTGGWCRPQTDGPGLRATTLVKYAQVLQKEGIEISDNLWEAIKTDIDYINANWQDDGCDLWEEVRSTDFFWNRMSFYQSLTLGAELASSLNNDQIASTWSKTAATIKPTILAHWNGQYIYESTNRKQDTSVIHALANLNEDLFAISGKETAATISSYSKAFCAEYPINQKDDVKGIPGILFGRYPGDEYAGGNPWQLLTASLAETFYQGAQVSLAMNSQYVAEDQLENWRQLLDLPSKVTPLQLAAAQKKAGNSVMYRIWVHVKSDRQYSLYEQMDKNTGVQMSAKNLTWSYANVLRVLHQYVFNDQYQAKFANLE